MTAQPPTLDLPIGPFCALLQSAHGLLTTYHAIAPEVVTQDAVDLHAEHMRRVAVHTADRSLRPRPDYTLGDDHHPEGWELLILGTDSTVVCGWHQDGTFHAWADAETIAATFRDTLVNHLGDCRDH